jgi:prephenate dehydratase
MRVIVALQGERGSFSHQAALDILGAEIELRPKQSFEAVFGAVSEGEAARAVVPIENSLVGSIHENYDRLRSGRLHIVAETPLRVRHCVIARPGATLAGITRVASHPVALAQCQQLFADHPGMEAVVSYDTAGAVMELMAQRSLQQAAIASRLAAEIHGAQILLEGVEDDPQNFTRFLVLSREEGPLERANKTSIVFTLENVPGALFRALGFFALRGVDLAKIESRPLRGRPWEYAFYLDVLGDPRAAAGEALAELRSLSHEFRILGSYPDGLKRQEP